MYNALKWGEFFSADMEVAETIFGEHFRGPLGQGVRGRVPRGASRKFEAYYD
jgi:hypothetical protein